MVQPPIRYERVPARSREDFSLAAVWQVLVIRRKTMLWTTITALVAAIAISLCMPTKYAGESSIEINPENSAAIDISKAPSRATRLRFRSFINSTSKRWT